MGLYSSLNLQCYIEVGASSVVKEEKHVKNKCSAVSSHQISAPGLATPKFCPECGSAVIQETTVTQKTKRLTSQELLDKANISDDLLIGLDWLTDGENFKNIILVSQKRNAGSISLDSERGAFNLCPITVEKITAEIKLFENCHSKEIEILKKIVGDDNVKVNFGFISSYN